jgi:hypothetical protein
MDEELEETYTYTLKFGVSTKYIGSDVTDTQKLEDYGYSDQDWDELGPETQDRLVDAWTTEYVWENIESWGSVDCE